MPSLDLRDVPSIPINGIELSETDRHAAFGTWKGRMVNEFISARVFAALIPQMMAADIPAVHITTVSNMIAEELSHARLCAGVLLGLGGDPVAQLPALPPVATHPEVEPLEALLRNILSICCLSETVAVALIGAERLDSGPEPIEHTLKEILGEEVGHARFGWRLLDELKPRIDEPMRDRLSDYLVTALQHLEEHELAHLPPMAAPSRAAAAVGVCDGNQARRLFFETVETVIIPGLEKRNFRAQAAWAACQTIT
jgi:hypothetical protein